MKLVFVLFGLFALVSIVVFLIGTFWPEEEKAVGAQGELPRPLARVPRKTVKSSDFPAERIALQLASSAKIAAMELELRAATEQSVATVSGNPIILIDDTVHDQRLMILEMAERFR